MLLCSIDYFKVSLVYESCTGMLNFVADELFYLSVGWGEVSKTFS